MRSKDKDLMKRIKSFIDEYALNNLGKAPTTREIGAEFGINHVTAHRYLISMTELGMLRYE